MTFIFVQYWQYGYLIQMFTYTGKMVDLLNLKKEER